MNSRIIEPYKNENRDIFNKRFGVIFNGEDNLKDVVVENLISNSPTASQCAWLYERFLGGAGFEVDLSKIDIGNSIFAYSPVHLLYDICEPISKHQGVFVHFRYNMNYQKDSFRVIPNVLCRVGEKDSNDYNGKIIFSKKGWGRDLKKENIIAFDVYNPKPEVIQAQVDAAGGWSKYNGQILYFKLSNKYTYSKSLIEGAYQFADTEHQLGMYYCGTTKRGFEDITIIRHRKFPDKNSENKFFENLEKLSGFENSSSKLTVEDDWDDEREKTGNFKFDTLKNEVKAEKYAHFETSAANYIRKAFKNIPPQLIDYVAGKLGNTSGEDLIKAQSVYNAIISLDQEKIEMLFAELFKNYKENINPSNNWTIKQYSLLDDGTVNYKNTPQADGNPTNQ